MSPVRDSGAGSGRRSSGSVPAPRRYRRWWILVAAGVLLGTAVVVVQFAPLGVPGPGGLRSFRPSEERPAPRSPLPDDFAGADACAECHAEQYDAWRRSTHGRAGAAPPGDAVIAPFDGRSLRFRDAVVIPTRGSAGDYRFIVRQEGRDELVLVVMAVVGGGHMVGGGTQSFWTRAADGTWRFIPFDWSRTGRTWFCNTNGRLDRGWLPIGPDLPLAACGDWPPRRVLGGHARFENCQQCHGSQIRLAWDPAARRYQTGFTTLAVNCESCHGPAARHVALAQAESLGADIGLRTLVPLGKDASLAVCFQCHALKEELVPGYLPGADFERHFSLGLPVLISRPHFPDGRSRLFVYQEQHRWSDCYRNGGMTCVSCHEPHGQGYWAVNRVPLVGRFDDHQCTSCHASKAVAPERHTYHTRGSPGSSCVACHMPYLQQPNTGDRVPYRRSDHTIAIPRATFDEGLGVASACRACHAEATRDNEAFWRKTASWWGAVKPHAPAVAAVFAAESLPDRLSEARRVLVDTTRHTAALYMGLSYFFLRRLSPDERQLEPEVVARLEALATHRDPDVRALALASLHFAAGEQRRVWRLLERQLRNGGREAGDEALRHRWARALTFRGDAYLGQRDPTLALVAYRKAWQVTPDDPAALRNLGAGYANTGDHARAELFYQESLARDSTQAATWTSLAFTLGQLGDQEGARAAYERAIALDPWDPAAYVSLGSWFARRGDAAQAARAWERALALDPSRAAAEFGLASAYAAMGRRQDARAAVRRGMQYEPDSPAARQLLQQLGGP